MSKFLILQIIFLISFATLSCNSNDQFVDAFKNTEAYPLAKAVATSDLEQIETIVTNNPELMEVHSETGTNALSLCIHLYEYRAFKKLLELGANPNYINPYSKYSVLIESCSYLGSLFDSKTGFKFAELLLEYGADPNYAVENKFVNSKGHTVFPTSALERASTINVDFVKLLLRFGADYKSQLEKYSISPFRSAMSSGKFEIIYFYIDSLNVDVHDPIYIRTDDSLFIQDYIHKYMNYKEESEGYKKKQELIKYLKSKGVDFENYKYKL